MTTRRASTIVTIRNANETICEINQKKHLASVASDWNEKIGDRWRWNLLKNATDLLQQEAHNALEQLGVTSRDLTKMVKGEVVEVSTKCHSNLERDVEARMIPWEYLISAATKRMRGKRNLTIVRHLSNIRRRNKKNRPSNREPKKFAFIGAVPDGFLNRLNFRAESDLVSSALRPSFPNQELVQPTREQVCEFMEANTPDVVHFSGLDQQFVKQIGWGYDPYEMTFQKNLENQIFLASENEEAIDPSDLAKSLSGHSQPPILVAINAWYSGARFAPACLKAGAETALGFNCSFDEKVAYSFFLCFYKNWLRNGRDEVDAFQSAWKQIKHEKSKVRGTAVTLWNSTSIADRKLKNKSKQTSYSFAAMRSPHLQDDVESIRRVIADPAVDSISDLVGVNVKPTKSLNFSLLNNQQSILDELYLWFRAPRPSDGRMVTEVKDVEVEVMLHVGNDSFPYRTRLRLGEDHWQIDLADQTLEASDGNPEGGICVALTSDLFRRVDEKMQTSMYVKVSWHDQILHEHTHSVCLSPIDEWKMDRKNQGWIPSFIQPRDPAINRIITSAQKYLCSIEDDPNASFCAYQTHDVIPQVKAIWSALIYEYDLKYINPPPAYGSYAQRLRSPSQVIEQGRGTCLDLTILFASCLEWIELRPTIFLTELHAFPGFWVSESAHRNWVEYKNSVGDTPIPVARQFPWATLRSSFDRVKECIAEEVLIPVEAVDMTRRVAYRKASQNAYEYFADPGCETAIQLLSEKENACFNNANIDYTGPFESLVDIKSSRKFVTPLPIYRQFS